MENHLKRIVAIDPGNEVSGWVEYSLELGRPVKFGNATPNEELLAILKKKDWFNSILVVEMFQPRGQPLYIQLVWTAVWIGRFVQTWGGHWDHLYRETVKHHLTGRTNSSDSNVNMAVKERWGGPKQAVGRKKNPGPLHGIHNHAWAALAVAVAYAEGARSEPPTPPVSKPTPDRARSDVGPRDPAGRRVGASGRPLRRVRPRGA